VANFSPTIRQLEVFIAVAHEKSFTRASKTLHLSQPAVSLQIKQLEEQVGLPLFERLGNKIFLTEAGRTIQACGRSLTQLLGDTEESIDELKGLHRGRLDLSVATTAAYFITRILADFAITYPDITVSLDVTNRKSLLQQLENNEPDLVIMGEPPADNDLAAQAFKENPLVLIAAASHSCAQRSSIPISELEKQSFVSREVGSGTRAAIQRFLESQNIDFNFSMEMTSNEAIKQAVEAGLGLGIVSAQSVELEIDAGKLVVLDIKGFPILRHWYIVNRTGKLFSPVAQLFQQFLLEHKNTQ